MKFETKCKKLNICDEVKSIIDNCELYEGKNARIVELSKLRKWEIQEEIGNYFEWIDKDGNLYDWNFGKEHMKTFLKAFEISEDRIAEWYAKAISEWGYRIAYEINSDVVLILE